MTAHSSGQLPIVEVLDTLREAFATHNELVLQAPPGAGKTTMVPIAMLNEPWMDGQSILLLEPRRMAAMATARRMAQMLGEPVGETVGYRIRLDNCVGPNTRIEVITEGILTRRMQRDPSLEGVGLVIFDEFHERNLNSDLGLALALHGRELFREGAPLKLLVMSATLDGEAVADLLGDAPLITSHGRQFPVTATYSGPQKIRESIIEPALHSVLSALQNHEGNILVFLPGQGEIRQLARKLSGAVGRVCDQPVLIAPLYGGLSITQQEEAIDAPPEGVRKIVLATNIAETSLTIQGIHTVVDSGLVREPIFDSGTGMARLATRRISRASAEQRMGRAGRLAPGHCYRLWSEEQHAQLDAQVTPEIMQVDLAPMSLQLLAWGVDNPDELRWLDVPPPGPYQQALAALENCGAVVRSDSGVPQLSLHGLRMAEIPLHPRLAHMLILGSDIGALNTASLLAALLSERNPLANGAVDIAASMAVLTGVSSCSSQHKGWLHRTQKQAKRFRSLVGRTGKSARHTSPVEEGDVLGVLLASAYPDRIAKLRSPGDPLLYQLANGRSAILPANDDLAGSKWLAVAEVGGRINEIADKIYSATRLNAMTFQKALSPLVQEQDHIHWDDAAGRFVAERRKKLGKIVLSKTPISEVAVDVRVSALLDGVRRNGLGILPWNAKLEQWRSRILLLRRADTDEQSRWPDLSNETLLASIDQWLSPYLLDVKSLSDFQKLDLKSILQALLPWPLPLDLERLAPERLVVPSGSNVLLDYSQTPPVLEVKLQEMFGCEETPSIADGKVALQVHLLSPARRPLQITQDLAGFWRSSYQDVKKEMKGRYPKHPWPDDPLSAEATRYTKRRMSEHA